MRHRYVGVMFRPSPQQPILGYFPLRVIVPVLVIVAAVVAIVAFLGLEHERRILEQVTNQGAPVESARARLIQTTALLFLFAGLCISALLTYQSYQSTKRTLERVKGLARNILHSIPSGVLTVDQAGRVTAINPMAERILGVTAESTLGRGLDRRFGVDDPIFRCMRAALDHAEFVRNLDIRYPLQEARWIRLTTSSLADHDHGRDGVVILLQDVTDLLVLEEQLRRSEKLSALHTLSAGVAHEIRNPLSAIDLNLHLLQEEIGVEAMDPEAVQRYSDIVNAEVRRIRGIVDNFLRFARPTSLVLGEVKLDGIARHIGELVRYEAEERGVEIRIDFPENLPAVPGDETQLGQVFLNLMINAVQAMPQGGILRVFGEERVADAGPLVEVSVSDTGLGINKADLAKVFEPFFSTKPDGHGLGLAIAYRIIEDHRGTIRVTSEAGAGTTFVLSFPAARVPDEQPVQQI
ncbi:MAG: ATP-binding protein [Nitrospirota bacterium]